MENGVGKTQFGNYDSSKELAAVAVDGAVDPLAMRCIGPAFVVIQLVVVPQDVVFADRGFVKHRRVIAMLLS